MAYEGQLRESLYTADSLKDIFNILGVLREKDGKVLIRESIETLIAFHKERSMDMQLLLYVRMRFATFIQRGAYQTWCSDVENVTTTFQSFFQYTESAFAETR